MTESSDELLLVEDEEMILAGDQKAESVVSATWKVLIVDDEEEVHRVTRMVLSGFSFAGKGLSFISAYSGGEARQLMQAHADTAIVLLDVVMERDDAGLEVVRYIREELNNRITRIILRTGQPGQAPEQTVIVNYDINDYKAKTELTAQKLATTIISTLRSYQQLLAIDANRRGLEKIIEACSSLFELRSMELFASGILLQLISLLHLKESSVLCAMGGFPGEDGEEELRIVAACGRFEPWIGRRLGELLDPVVSMSIATAYEEKTNCYFEDHCVVYFHARQTRDCMVYVEGCQPLNELDKKLVAIFSVNVAIAFDNILLYSQLHHELTETKAELQQAQWRLEIDEEKKRREVAAITETDYFIQLQQKVRKLKSGKTLSQSQNGSDRSRPGAST